jgi:phospholipid transport system transporter-binding protein
MFACESVLNLSNAVQVATAGIAAINKGERDFDLSPLNSVDSSAVAVLLGWQRYAKEKNIELHFSGFSSNLQSLMTLYGIEQFFVFDGPTTKAVV